MAVARGNTKIILNKVGEIQNLIGEASAYIDTSKQYEIRSLLEKALKVCIEVRDMYDPT